MHKNSEAGGGQKQRMLCGLNCELPFLVSKVGGQDRQEVKTWSEDLKRQTLCGQRPGALF